jgi:hypothetical protein
MQMHIEISEDSMGFKDSLQSNSLERIKILHQIIKERELLKELLISH